MAVSWRRKYLSHFNLQPSLKFRVVVVQLVGRTENFHVRNNARWNPLFPLRCGDDGFASKLEEFSEQRGGWLRDDGLCDQGSARVRADTIFPPAGARKCVISSVQYLVGKFWRCSGGERLARSGGKIFD